MNQPDQYYYYSASGDSTGPSTTTTEMGIRGGGAFTEAQAVRESSSKRKWSSREADDLVRSDPSSSADTNSPSGSTFWPLSDGTLRYEANYFSKILRDYLRRPTDERSTDIKPPDHSTATEIIQFLNRETPDQCSAATDECIVKVNHSLAKEDEMAPKAHRRYVTTSMMMSDLKTFHSYWKDKGYELVEKWKREGSDSEKKWLPEVIGIKRTFRFHTINGDETNWFMHEYIPLGRWGIDMFMKELYFREVFQEADAPPECKGKQRVNTNGTTSGVCVKHRMRRPDNLIMVANRESPAWHDFIKIYDKHPELKGSKVVYAVCCHCEEVLKAESKNGTSSLSRHLKDSCPVLKQNKEQQPRPSR